MPVRARISALAAVGALALAAALPAQGQSPSPSVPSGSAPSPPEAAPPRRVCTVAAIGDSLTDARSHGGKFLDLLRERCPESRFDNYGKGGEMANQMRRRFARDLFGDPAGEPSQKPTYTHVIVFGGVNDLYSDLTAGRTPAKVGRDLGTMYDLAHAQGVEVVAVTVAPWGGFKRYYNARRGAATRELNAWIGAQKAAARVDHVVDAYRLLSCGDPERLCPAYVKPANDGLHFNADGHRKLGEALHHTAFRDCR